MKQRLAAPSDLVDLGGISGLGAVARDGDRLLLAAQAIEGVQIWDVTHPDGLELFDAWVKHSYSDAFAIKFGQFKTPFTQNIMTPIKHGELILFSGTRAKSSAVRVSSAGGKWNAKPKHPPGRLVPADARKHLGSRQTKASQTSA